MAVKSIKCKLDIEGEKLEKMQNAYEVFNQGVHFFELFFILAQGKDYYCDNENEERIYRSCEEVESELDDYLKSIEGICELEKCKEALKKVADIISEKGSQLAGSLKKLYDKESSAGTNAKKKIIHPLPDFVEKFNLKTKQFESEEDKQKADEWIQSDDGKRLIAPLLKERGLSKFKKAYLEGKEWYAGFISDQMRFRKDCEDGLASILEILEECNALPIIKLPEALISNHPRWVKFQLKTALENFASYLASDQTTRENYKQLEAECQKLYEKVEDNYSDELHRVDEYLKTSYYSNKREVYLTRRMCRGIDTIRIECHKGKDETERKEFLKKCQTDKKLQRSIGDINFLNWLVLDQNYSILEKPDCLNTILKYYLLLGKKDRMQKCASFTPANCATSKRYLFYEAEQGSNFKKYRLRYNDDQKLCVSFPLLIKDATGNYKEEEVQLRVLPNAQFQAPYDVETNQKEEKIQFIKEKKEIKVIFSDGKRIQSPVNDYDIWTENYVGKLGGADILVDTNAEGRIKKAFLAMSIDVEEKCSGDFIKISSNMFGHFASAYTGNETKYEKNLDGKRLRALSIDLGLKQLGAVSVCSLNYEMGMDSNHQFELERMFLLKLEGEKVSARIEERRGEAMKEIADIKSEIKYLSELRSLYHMDSIEQRKKLIKTSSQYVKNEERRKMYEECCSCNSIEAMDEVLRRAFEVQIHFLDERMKEFRSSEKTAKNAHREYEPGKSFWSISYLENIRKLIMAWNAQGRKIDSDNQLMNREYGVTATHLLEHINHLKEDRIKTGADMIVQAARGMFYNDEKKCWVQKYEPCHMIIFENLSRYRFSSDRPKAENSKLQKWSHREIVEEVKRQAALYGISVYADTDAMYTSKFYYKNDAPGIRADRLSQNDFDNEKKLKEGILKSLPQEFQNNADKLKIGSLVPSEIGSIFVTMDQEGQLVEMNADMNAACNLQKRFWGRHTHLLHMATHNTNGHLSITNTETKSDIDDEQEAVAVNQGMGKIVKGKLLYHFGTAKVILQEKAGKENHFVCVPYKKGMQEPFVGEDYTYHLYRDDSGVFFKEDEWIGYKEFWNTIKEKIYKGMIDAL